MGFGKDGKGVIIRERETFTIGTLAVATGIIGNPIGITEDFRMLKSRIRGSIINVTAGDGPFDLYLINGDFTLAQAEAAPETEGPLGPADRINQETAERFVRYVGQFVPVGDGTVLVFVPHLHEDPKVRWTFTDTKSWNWMVYNNSAQAPQTGGLARIDVTHYGVWVV